MSKIDKFGECPNCKVSWLGNDMFDELNHLSIFKNKSQKEVQELANLYGYSEHNRTRYTKVITIQLEDGRMFYKCPEMRCGMVFDPESGVQYENIEETSKSIEKVSWVIDVDTGVTQGNREDFAKAFEKARVNLDMEITTPIEYGTKGELDPDDEIIEFDVEPKEVDGGTFEDIHEFDKFFKKKKL